MAVSKVILNGETLIDVTQKTVTPSNMLSGITALKNDGTDITGSIAAKSAADLITSGSQVTVPSGMYAAAATTAVASGSINLNFDTQVSLDSDSFNINPNTGVVYVNGGVISTGQPGFSSGYISDPGYYMIEASASGSYALPTRTSSDLSASGSVVTIPSGWYGATASKAVASGTLNGFISVPSILPTWSLNSSTGIINAYYETALGIQPIASSGYFETNEYIYPTITMDSNYQLPVKTVSDLSASGSVVTVPSGWYGTTASKAVAAGSITIPSHSFDIKPDITLDSATGKIDLWKSLSYTIPVSLTSGYIAQASGPRVAATVDSSYQLPVKAAATIVPSTSDQVVASGYFLTGTQIIKGDSALIPSNIAAGVSIFGIEGTHQGGGNLQDNKTVDPSASQQIVTADQGFDGLEQVTVEAAALQSKVVTPSTEQQIIVPDSSLYGTIPAGTLGYIVTGYWYALSGVYPPSPISVGTHVEGVVNVTYNNDVIGTITINGDITTSHFESICTLTTDSSLQLGSAVWDSDGLNFYLNLTEGILVAATDIRFDSLPVANYYGLSQVTVEAVAATSSYYVTQDSEGYLCYSSVAPSSGGYYVFNVSSEHIEPPVEYQTFEERTVTLNTIITGMGDNYYMEDYPAINSYSFNPKLTEGAHYRITRDGTQYTGIITSTSSGDTPRANIENDFNNWDSSFPFGMVIYDYTSQYSNGYAILYGDTSSGSHSYKIELEDSEV